MAVNKEEARLLFIDHKHGEISLQSQLALYSPDAFLVVMAVDDRSTLCQAELLLSQLSSRNLLLSKPVILVANKTDLVRNRVIKQSGQYLALSFQINIFYPSILRTIIIYYRVLDGKQLATQYRVKYIETSPGSF